MDDRHARHRRAGVDIRRRPVDGYRPGRAGRFRRLVEDALRGLPAALREPALSLPLVIEALPNDADLESGRPVPLAVVAKDPPRLVVYRRPVELRAATRDEIGDLVEAAAGRAVAQFYGLDDTGLDDPGLDDPGSAR